MPPGGPPDQAMPEVVRTTPDSGAVGVRGSSVLIRFDEVVSERGGARMGAGSGMEGLVLVSPSDGRDRVHWRRTAIEVEPRGGFRPNTAYRVTLLPGLADLRGNVRSEPHEVVFSTGQSIPTGRIDGAVFDWAAGRAAPLAWVQAHRGTDSTFRWIARADSTGRYALRDLAPGAYRVRAFLDQDNDRRHDEREAFDSLTVVVSEAPTDTVAPGTTATDFYAFVHDTIGPGIEIVEPVDSLALRIRFDRPTAVDWAPDSAASFILQRADSSSLPIGAILPAARLDSLLALDRARADSIARAADTTAAADTAAVTDSAAVAARADAIPAPVPPVLADTADTAATRAPQMTRPVPVQVWAVRLPAALLPGTYRLSAVAIPGLGGARRNSTREFTIREPVPRDTTTPPETTTPPATTTPPDPAPPAAAPPRR